jgi:hypothetical protein
VILGDINAAGRLTIGEDARITSQVRAGSVVVTGEVKGDIVGLERVEICRSAVVWGSLTSPILQIEAGATLDGHLSTMYEWPANDHPNEFDVGQIGFPFLTPSEQRVIAGAAGLDGRRTSEARSRLRRLNIHDLLARLRTTPCDECLRPIRWWHRRVWLVDRQGSAHLHCWKGRLFLKEFVADQIRSVQLMTGENSASSSSSDSELEERQASARG